MCYFNTISVRNTWFSGKMSGVTTISPWLYMSQIITDIFCQLWSTCSTSISILVTYVWRYVTDIATLRSTRRCSPLAGLERTTSDLPSVSTTNYSKEKLAISWRGWPITYLRTEFYRFTPVTFTPLKLTPAVSWRDPGHGTSVTDVVLQVPSEEPFAPTRSCRTYHLWLPKRHPYQVRQRKASCLSTLVAHYIPEEWISPIRTCYICTS